MAWLDTRPRTKDGKELQPRRTKYEGDLPEPGELAYLYGYLCESGPLATWGEIKAWAELNGIELEPWEARTLWEISCAYLEQIELSREPNCLPPWKDEAQAGRAVESKISAILRKAKG
jgi:hypothetical protein